MSAATISYYIHYLVSVYTLARFARTCWEHLLVKPEADALAPRLTVFELLLIIPNVLAILALLALPWFGVHSSSIVTAVWALGLLPTFVFFVAAYFLNPEKVHHFKLLTLIFDICVIETPIKRPTRKL